MIKAKVLGKIKPETIVCLNGKYTLYLVEDIHCYNKEYEIIDNPKLNDICYFDEWFWNGDIRQLNTILGINYEKSISKS